MKSKSWFVRTGDFFFKYRNYLFPVSIVVLAFIRPPVDEYFGSHKLEEMSDWLALFLVLTGLAIRGWVIGFRYIKRGGVDRKVYAADLVTEGMFGVCRNPLYVGNLVIYLGLLVMHGEPLVIFIGTVFFLFVYNAIVAAEEYFLRKKFGKGYDDYCKDVPRWGFRLSRYKEATKGMQFNFGRVLIKDYATMANSLIALCLLEMVEEVVYRREDFQSEVYELGGAVVAIIAVALLIRLAKKRKLIVAT